MTPNDDTTDDRAYDGTRIAAPDSMGDPMPGWRDRAARHRASLGVSAEDAQRAERERNWLREQDLLNAAATAGLYVSPRMAAVMCTDSPAPTVALNAVRATLAWRAARSTRRCLQGAVCVIVGPPGTGKSCALAWVAVRHPAGAKVVDAQEVAATPRSGFSTNRVQWEEWLAVDLLCVDEIGCEGGDPALITTLLHGRYNRGRVTLVAGNVGQEDCVARYITDPRLADRLVREQAGVGSSDGLPWFVQTTGPSLRDSSMRAALTLLATSA